MNQPLTVKIKRLHENAVIPTYATPGDAGMDLTAVTRSLAIETDKPYTEYGTGLSVEIPQGYVGLIYPRSSITSKAQTLANCVGVIDSSYRGEIKFRFKMDTTAASFIPRVKTQEEYNELMQRVYGDEHGSYKVGDKIGQLIIMPFTKVTFTEVTELTTSERGESGFGSTGN